LNPGGCERSSITKNVYLVVASAAKPSRSALQAGKGLDCRVALRLACDGAGKHSERPSRAALGFFTVIPHVGTYGDNHGESKGCGTFNQGGKQLWKNKFEQREGDAQANGDEQHQNRLSPKSQNKKIDEAEEKRPQVDSDLYPVGKSQVLEGGLPLLRWFEQVFGSVTVIEIKAEFPFFAETGITGGGGVMLTSCFVSSVMMMLHWNKKGKPDCRERQELVKWNSASERFQQIGERMGNRR
jgi:hypothetical protein